MWTARSQVRGGGGLLGEGCRGGWPTGGGVQGGAQGVRCVSLRAASWGMGMLLGLGLGSFVVCSLPHHTGWD